MELFVFGGLIGGGGVRLLVSAVKMVIGLSFLVGDVENPDARPIKLKSLLTYSSEKGP